MVCFFHHGGLPKGHYPLYERLGRSKKSNRQPEPAKGFAERGLK